MTIRELCEQAHANARDKGFHDYKGGYMDRVPLWLALAHSELSEALEAWRCSHLANIAEELADVVIRVADMSQAMCLDLEAEIERKMAANRVRPHMHKGKRA